MIDRGQQETALATHAAFKEFEGKVDEEVMRRIVDKIESRETQAYARVLHDAALHSLSTLPRS